MFGIFWQDSAVRWEERSLRCGSHNEFHSAAATGRPRNVRSQPEPGEAAPPAVNHADPLTFPRIVKAWSPFLLLSAFVVLWGLAPVAKVLDSVSLKHPVPGLHLQVVRMPPVVVKEYAEPASDAHLLTDT